MLLPTDKSENAMIVTFPDFLNAANKLRFLDRDQVPFLSDAQWPAFRDDPVRFTLSPKNRGVAERIWEAANLSSKENA